MLKEKCVFLKEENIIGSNDKLIIDDNLDSMQTLMLNKNSIKEINKIIEPTLKEHILENVSFIKKIKILFSINDKSNDQITLLSSVIGCFFIFTFIPIITTIIDSNFINSIPYIGILLFILILGSISINKLYSKNCEDIIKNKNNEKFLNSTVNKEMLIKISFYLDEEDKKIVQQINKNNNEIKIIDIINILEKKKLWILNNEGKIKKLIESENNSKILED